jgi:hypothetical protein
MIGGTLNSQTGIYIGLDTPNGSMVQTGGTIEFKAINNPGAAPAPQKAAPKASAGSVVVYKSPT